MTENYQPQIQHRYDVTTVNDIGEEWTNYGITYVCGGGVAEDRAGRQYLGFRKGRQRYLIDESSITALRDLSPGGSK
jgi:hypothetical protein